VKPPIPNSHYDFGIFKSKDARQVDGAGTPKRMFTCKAAGELFDG